MEKKKWVPWAQYGVTTLIGLGLTVGVALLRGLTGGLPGALVARYLSDGAAAAGIFLGGIGLLVWIAGTDFFDIFSYAAHSFATFVMFWRRLEKPARFYDYKTQRAEKRGKPIRFIFMVGLGFLLLSGGLLALYYAA